MGNNMFAYCGNNPVMLVDIMGFVPRVNLRIISDGTKINSGQIGFMPKKSNSEFSRINMDTEENPWTVQWFDTDWPTLFSFTNEGVEVVSWNLSVFSCKKYLNSEMDRSIYCSVGNIDAYAGVHAEQGVGAEAGVGVLSLGYDGKLIDVSFDLLSLGAACMFRDGKFGCKANPGIAGIGIAIDIPAVLGIAFGGV